MNVKLDQILRDALSEEEKELWDDLLEPSPLQIVVEHFRSRNRALNILGVVMGLIFMGVGIWTLSGFAEAGGPLEAMRWGLGFIVCMWGLWSIKVWSWMEIQRNTLTREIKRLELQIVHLGAELRGKAAE
jgi:hypothetical protein